MASPTHSLPISDWNLDLFPATRSSRPFHLLVAALAEEPGHVDSGELLLGAELWPEPMPLEFLEQVAWASAALRCEPVVRLTDASKEPLSASRFLTSLWWSAPNTMLRLDRTPRDLYDEHCRGRVPAEVEAFYRRVTFADQLPIRPRPDELVVIDDCAAVVASTDRPESRGKSLKAPPSLQRGVGPKRSQPPAGGDMGTESNRRERGGRLGRNGRKRELPDPPRHRLVSADHASVDSNTREWRGSCCARAEPRLSAMGSRCRALQAGRSADGFH